MVSGRAQAVEVPDFRPVAPEALPRLLPGCARWLFLGRPAAQGVPLRRRVCPHCHGRRRLLGGIFDPAAITAMLDNLGLHAAMPSFKERTQKNAAAV
jgi:hypothetical protein